MKKYLPTVILILVFCVGLFLLLYPTISDYWNSLHQSRAIAEYAQAVAEVDNETYEAVWSSAQSYNEALARTGAHWVLSEEEKAEYNSHLDVSGTGIMAYIEIPKIGCSLPIYHGTNEAVLQTAIGHIEGSSLPVGGESTHCVLSGHRGLPSAKLFTDLNQLTLGDTFQIRTLDETLTYEVDQILTVLPHELDDLKIEEGQDLCTLVTCTPYGINTHRLLVRGHRINSQTATVRVAADALQIEPTTVAPLVAVPILLLLLIWLLVKTRRKKLR